MRTRTLSSLDRFDDEYPEELPERLAWLETHLKVSRDRMLQLMGLVDCDRSRLKSLAWPEITKGHEAEADRTEHLLTHYLSYFDYDIGKATEFATKFSNDETSADQLTEYVPALARASTESDREAILLQAFQLEGPSLLPVVAKLIASSTTTVNGERTTRTRRRRPQDS